MAKKSTAGVRRDVPELPTLVERTAGTASELPTSVFTWDARPETLTLTAADDLKALFKARATWKKAVRTAAEALLAAYPRRFRSVRVRRHIEDGLHAMFGPAPRRPTAAKPRGRPRDPLTKTEILRYKAQHPGKDLKAVAQDLKRSKRTVERRLRD